MHQTLSEAVDAYIWLPDAAIPGRHPERVADPADLRDIESLMRAIDDIRPDETAVDLFAWSDRQAREVAARFDGRLDESAIAALRALISWMWR